MEDKYIGFDIDSKKTVACVVQQGRKDRYATFPTDLRQMQQFLSQERQSNTPLHLTFEISGEAGYRYDALQGHVETLTVSNPSKMTWIFRTSKKNDRIDARKQAVLLSIGEVPKVHIPAKAVRQWRVTIQCRRKLVDRTTALKSRIRALLKSQGVTRPGRSKRWWNKANGVWMRELTQGFGEVTGETLWRANLGTLLEELATLETQLKAVTAYLDGYLKDHPGAALLRSIPGVGPRTTEAILAYTDDIRRFKRSRQYCAYFGLTPKLDESGSIRRLGHISKEGPSVVRWLLTESAWHAIRRSPGLKAFYERVRGGHRDRRKIAIVAVARKLVSIIRAMLLTGELFNESLVGGVVGSARV
jgi:transposase